MERMFHFKGVPSVRIASQLRKRFDMSLIHTVTVVSLAM